MKKILIQVILFLTIQIANGQNFNKKIYQCYNCSPATSIIRFDSVKKECSIINGFQNRIILDSLGNVLTELNYVDDNVFFVSYTPSATFLPDNKFLITNFEYKQGTTTTLKSISYFDSTGSIIFSKAYDFPVSPGNNPLEYSSDNILTGGTDYIWPNPLHTPYLSKLDTAGNLIWNKKYTGISGKLSFIARLNDSEYLLGLELVDGNGACVCKVDSSGKIIWSKSFMRPIGKFYSYTINQDIITMIGMVDTDGPGNNFSAIKFFFLQVDTSGALITSKQLGDTIHSIFPSYILDVATIKPTNDNGFIITTATETNTSSGSRLVLVKTDYAGNIQWVRSHGAAISDEFGADIIQTFNGGFLALGGVISSMQGISGYYLIKTDSLGFAGCQETSDTIPVATLNITDSIITITDSAFTVNTYTSTVHDTIMPPAQVMDGCTLGGWHEISVFNKSKLLSYPNPTQGQFQIKTGSTNAYMVTVTVYDTKGVQLFEKKYRNAADVKLDLTGYGKGVYSIRIVDNKTTRWSKVVVE